MSSSPHRRMKIGDFLLRRLEEAGVLRTPTAPRSSPRLPTGRPSRAIPGPGTSFSSTMARNSKSLCPRTDDTKVLSYETCRMIDRQQIDTVRPPQEGMP